MPKSVGAWNLHALASVILSVFGVAFCSVFVALLAHVWLMASVAK